MYLETLSIFSKIFQKLVYNHVNSYVEPKFSKYLVQFHRNHNTQHAHLKMRETKRAMLKKGKKVAQLKWTYLKHSTNQIIN